MNGWLRNPAQDNVPTVALSTRLSDWQRGSGSGGTRNAGKRLRTSEQALECEPAARDALLDQACKDFDLRRG